jgi:hypothetical protein
MNTEKVRKHAVEVIDSLLDELNKSVNRGAAIFGVEEMLSDIIPSFLGFRLAEIKVQTGKVYTGERRDLQELLGCKDWISTALTISDMSTSRSAIIKPGDYFRLPIKANAGSFDCLEFEALDIPSTELVVTHIADGKIIFNFEEVLFSSAINKKDTNKGGFKESALCKYLNIQFLDALDPIREVLVKNKDGNLVTFPTLFEVLGNDSEGKDVNWEDEPRQLEYFKQIKNRIRTKENDTEWWWLSTASHATDFVSVNSLGNAGSGNASGVYGVAPAICIIRPPAP